MLLPVVVIAKCEATFGKVKVLPGKPVSVRKKVKS
jgi:hypothetical protein